MDYLNYNLIVIAALAPWALLGLITAVHRAIKGTV